MADEAGQISVGETVRILDRYLPEKLGALRASFSDPNSAAVLTPGGDIMGEDEGLDPAVAATAALLADLDGVCLGAVLAVRRKLVRSNLFELIGKLFAASSCGALIVVILRAAKLEDASVKALLLAIVGFLATAMPLLVRWMRDGIGGNTGTLDKQFSALRDISIETRALRPQLAAASTNAEAAPRRCGERHLSPGVEAADRSRL